MALLLARFVGLKADNEEVSSSSGARTSKRYDGRDDEQRQEHFFDQIMMSARYMFSSLFIFCREKAQRFFLRIRDSRLVVTSA